MLPIAPILGGAAASVAAESAIKMAAAALGGSKGKAPGSEQENTQSGEEGSQKGILERLLGIPAFDPMAAKTAVIQGAVITALVVLFFIGLAMFVSRSVKV